MRLRLGLLMARGATPSTCVIFRRSGWKLDNMGIGDPAGGGHNGKRPLFAVGFAAKHPVRGAAAAVGAGIGEPSGCGAGGGEWGGAGASGVAAARYGAG